jgi:hypothetical protein
MCAGKDGRKRGPGGGARHSRDAISIANARTGAAPDCGSYRLLTLTADLYISHCIRRFRVGRDREC